jgi:ankyrin repeat protein
MHLHADRLYRAVFSIRWANNFLAAYNRTIKPTAGRGNATFALKTKRDDMIFRIFLFIFLISTSYMGPPDIYANDLDERLQSAIAKEDLETVKRLVYQIKDINSVKNWVGSPLHNAAFTRSLDIIKIHVENGADINAKNKDGQTPLHCAAYVASLDILKYFVEEKKVNLNQSDVDGRKPIHYSASKGSIGAVKYLVRHGANANVKDNNGVTPLHEAPSRGSLTLVKYLCTSQNAEVNAIDKRHGFTPLHWAAMSKSLHVVEYLIGAGSNVNLRDYRGNTILHIAALSGSLDVVRYLVEERRIKIDIRNSEKLRPIDLAAEKKESDIVKYFLKQKK